MEQLTSSDQKIYSYTALKTFNNYSRRMNKNSDNKTKS